MKKLILLAFMIPFYGFCQMSKRASLDEKNGFLIFKLGDTISNLKINSIPKVGFATADKYGVTTYMITDPSILKIGDEVTLENIKVNYYKGRLFSIDLYFDGSYYSRLNEILSDAYGPHDDNKSNDLNFKSWTAKKVSLSSMYIKYAKFQRASFKDISLTNQVELAMKESIKNAAKDL